MIRRSKKKGKSKKGKSKKEKKKKSKIIIDIRLMFNIGIDKQN